MSPIKSTQGQKDFVRKLVVESEIKRESLPYHTEFDVLFTKYEKSDFPQLTKNEFWELILRSTKAGEFFRKFEKRANTKIS